VDLPCPLTVIGTVRSARSAPEDTPVQAALNRSEAGTIEVFEPYAAGLEGLDGFDYAWLITWLHAPDRPGPAPMTQVPFLLRPQRREVGIFATRGPRRVNPIGLSLVSLSGIDGREIGFRGVDVVDGTPVIDLKPYVSGFDRPPGPVRCGWFDSVPMPPGVTPAALGEREIGP
jgi:tRNA-Thr(GGU) m(6)t(6)A37 methyltransferase TsaA